MKLFLGIDLSDSLKEKLLNLILPLKKEYPQFDWVPTVNYHITIHFFGEVDSYEAIVKRIEEVTFDKKSFQMFAYSVGMFINQKITIYLDFSRQKLLEIIAEQTKILFNNADKQKYIPHLTLAQYKKPSKQQYFVIKKRLTKEDIDFSFDVKKLTLFESINSSYKVLKRIPLL